MTRLQVFFAPGKFYYYLINFVDIQMEYVHPNIKQVSGIEPHEFTIENYLDMHHPDDLKIFHKKENVACDFLFNVIEPEQIPLYKVVYMNRIRRTDGKYIKLLHQAKALKISNDGKIQHVLGIHTDISHLNIPIDHKVSFIGDGELPSYYSRDLKNISFEEVPDFQQKFTHQEMRIIQLIAAGKSTTEIAELLSVAESTVKTHRKNILLKSGARNSAHLIANCLREGII